MAEGPGELWPGSGAGPDWRALYERERERAEAAGARAEELRWAEVRARCDAGYWKSRWGASRRRLREVVAATREARREARRAARDALALQREVERLRGLLREAGVCAGKRSTVMALRMEVERLRRKGRAQEKALDARGAEVRTLRRRIKHLEGRLAELRESRTVLPKGKSGGGSERRERPRSKRPRGWQPGAPAHGRTARPLLEERTEEHDPPADARVCGDCGSPYAANGAEESSLDEIEVRAHRRVIRRRRAAIIRR